MQKQCVIENFCLVLPGHTALNLGGFSFFRCEKVYHSLRSLSVKAVVLYWAYDQALISITKKNPLFVPLVQNFMLLYREGEQNSNELQTILHILKRDIISSFLVKFRNSTVRLGYFILIFFLGKKSTLLLCTSTTYLK